MSDKCVLLILLFLQGCATYKDYPGPRKADTEIAILEGYWHYYVVGVRIVKFDTIDGRPIQATGGDVTRVMLSPGRHSIGLRLASAFGEIGMSSSCIFEAEFEKGHQYRIVSFEAGTRGAEISLEMKRSIAESVSTFPIVCRRIGG
jgi:hypothetical protein